MAKKKYHKAGGKQDAGIGTTVTELELRHWKTLARYRQRPHTKMVADAIREFVANHPLPEGFV